MSIFDSLWPKRPDKLTRQAGNKKPASVAVQTRGVNHNTVHPAQSWLADRFPIGPLELDAQASQELIALKLVKDLILPIAEAGDSRQSEKPGHFNQLRAEIDKRLTVKELELVGGQEDESNPEFRQARDKYNSVVRTLMGSLDDAGMEVYLNADALVSIGPNALRYFKQALTAAHDRSAEGMIACAMLSSLQPQGYTFILLSVVKTVMLQIIKKYMHRRYTDIRFDIDKYVAFCVTPDGLGCEIKGYHDPDNKVRYTEENES